MIVAPMFYQSWLRPDSQATLDLDFAGTKQLDGRITFTRASASGMYFDESGVGQFAASNEPVFDHDPITGESLGLRVEAAGTNLLLRSQEFDNAYWAKVNCTISSNTIAAPDGTMTADKIVESSDSEQIHSVQVEGAMSSGVQYATSLFAKAGERSWVYINDIQSSGVYFNLADGSFGTQVGSPINIEVLETPDGWYRLSYSSTAANNSAGISITLAEADGDRTYSGDGTSGIYIWGAQLETGSRASSYIPTEASQVTRLADSAVITGSNFSSWYNASEGTFVVEYISPTQNAVANVSDGTLNNRMIIFNGTTGQVGVNAGGPSQGTLDGGSPSFVNANKLAFAYSVNNLGLSLNGGAPVTDTSALIPSVDRINIGNRNSDVHLNGTIKRITYYQKAVPNQLQVLSS